MPNILSKGIEKIRDKVEPYHRVDKEFDSDGVTALRFLSTAGLASSIALAAIGIPLAFTDGSSGDVGKVIVFVTLPLCFFAYNGVKFSENLYEVVNNPSAYKHNAGVGNFKVQKLKDKLRINTIGVSPLINLTVDEYVKWSNKKN